MFDLQNFTFFHAQQFQSFDQLDRVYNTIVAKVSYDFYIDNHDNRAELQFSETQTLLHSQDIYEGDPMRSSILAECDFVIYKPKVDIIINATAYSPNEKKIEEIPACIQIGDYKKSLVATGERHWIKEVIGWTLGKPKSIYSLPIRYEYAFGGIHAGGKKECGYLQENLVGKGSYSNEFLKRNSYKKLLEAHQIYDPTKPILEPNEINIPEGFGFFARYFASRVQYSGTTDTEWMENRAPLLPKDFSMSFWNGAHPELQIPYLKHNHVYKLTFIGLIPSYIAPKQRFSILLPIETLFVHALTVSNFSIALDLKLDTILVDVEKRKIDCSYRIALPEELEIEQCQLRYISRNERQLQIELAKEYERVRKTDFIIIPPSLR